MSHPSGERVVPLIKANDPDWCLDPANLAELYRHLREKGTEPDPVYFMEKPWHFSNEWISMWQGREVSDAS